MDDVKLTENASPEDIGEIYRLAFEMHRKGITVCRYGSRKGQVLTFDG